MPKNITAPAPSGGGIEWEELKKKLLVIEPLEIENGIKTVHGEANAIRANVYVLTGPDTHDAYEDTLIFPKVLFNQLKKSLDSLVVGRLTQGEKKPGQNAPWLLAEASEKDMEKATKFINSMQVTSASKVSEKDDADEDDDYEDDDDDSY